MNPGSNRAAGYRGRKIPENGKAAPKLALEGPYELNPIIIDMAVREVFPGSYALGNVNGEGRFIAGYVGRTDRDLRRQLRFWASRNPGYKSFMASYAKTPEAAFLLECRSFHDCGGCDALDNTAHPRPPEGYDIPCPVCGLKQGRAAASHDIVIPFPFRPSP